MAKDPIKKAENGTYYFRANLGFHPITGKQIQKYKSGFKTKKEAREAYSKLMLTSTEELTEKKNIDLVELNVNELDAFVIPEKTTLYAGERFIFIHQ